LSKSLEAGSKRRVDHGLKGPVPILVEAATLTVYETPAVRFVRRSEGVVVVTVRFVTPDPSTIT